jgi:DNA-binding NtrC family response regulator
MATIPYPQSSSDFGGVLVASGDAARRDQIVSTLRTSRWPVMQASGGADALEKLEASECDVLLLDRCLPDLDPDELVRMVRQQYPGVEVVELGAAGATVVPGLPLIVNAEAGPGPERPRQGERAERKPGVEPLPGMVGSSEAMQKMYRLVRLVAPRKTTVLITGPTGSGKELVARAVHELSLRAGRPFVALNCAAIPEPLLESELFGYSRGAFTGAVQSRIGRIQAAQGGTLFLDEIGEMPAGLQAKLLRFLECGELQRLGSTETAVADVRVVAATNADLLMKVKEGTFRQDLYFRLAVFPVELPGLVEHRGDLKDLARFLLHEVAGEEDVSLGDAAIRLLESHTWPGNVRELRHVLERAVILAEGEKVILPAHVQFSNAV